LKEEYKDRIFTTGMAGYPKVTHIPERKNGKPKDFSEIIELARTCSPPTEIETGKIIGGFAHNQIIALADKVHKRSVNWTDSIPDWHNVNMSQSFGEPATYYMQTGDKKYLEAPEKRFNGIRELYGHVPGGMFASDENCREGFFDPHDQGLISTRFQCFLNSQPEILDRLVTAQQYTVHQDEGGVVEQAGDVGMYHRNPVPLGHLTCRSFAAGADRPHSEQRRPIRRQMAVGHNEARADAADRRRAIIRQRWEMLAHLSASGAATSAE